MTTKRSHRLTMGDRLSRLTHVSACQLIGGARRRPIDSTGAAIGAGPTSRGRMATGHR